MNALCTMKIPAGFSKCQCNKPYNNITNISDACRPTQMGKKLQMSFFNMVLNQSKVQLFVVAPFAEWKKYTDAVLFFHISFPKSEGHTQTLCNIDHWLNSKGQ